MEKQIERITELAWWSEHDPSPSREEALKRLNKILWIAREMLRDVRKSQSAST